MYIDLLKEDIILDIEVFIWLNIDMNNRDDNIVLTIKNMIAIGTSTAETNEDIISTGYLITFLSIVKNRVNNFESGLFDSYFDCFESIVLNVSLILVSI